MTIFTRLTSNPGYIQAAALSEQAAKSVAQRSNALRHSLCSAAFSLREPPSMPAAWECSMILFTPARRAAFANINNK